VDGAPERASQQASRVRHADQHVGAGSPAASALRQSAEPTTDVAGYLHLDDGEEVVARRRVMLLAGEPIQLATSYYPASLAAGTELAQPEKLPGGTIATLERRHLELTTFEEHISARMPTGPEAAQLNMGPGTPVLVHVRVTRAIGDLPVEVGEHIMRADQNRMTYVLPART
jgi:GntR family transcriptional regulator